VFSSSYKVPRIDVLVGGIVTASSAPPYNVTTGRDDNNNRTTNDRPIVDGKMIPPYSERGSNYFNIDLRLSKLVRLGQHRRLEVLWEMFNVTNRVNYGGYVGNQRSTNFGKPSYAMAPFQGQFGVRFDF
jgi:hypothetical protein